ncbi:response regulator [Dyadobacter diqingensis]|uniref:response regulator n=1 Tax=Dyadobacter diqingensis TaxID=2938121 RepID=UPI0020C26A08|nr:response regulator transcription factor [Dyadobacter diqingensis]
MQNPLHILIIEDHDIVALAVKGIVSNIFPGAIITSCTDFSLALLMFDENTPFDLIILDIEVPGSESFNMIDILRKKQSDSRILIFTGYDEKKYAVKFLMAGANGFLSKNSPSKKLEDALRTILNGSIYVSTEIQQMINHQYISGERPEKKANASKLSPREKEVLDLILAGKVTKEIASQLDLKLTTVSTHKARIFEKLNVSNLIGLFKLIQPE